VGTFRSLLSGFGETHAVLLPFHAETQRKQRERIRKMGDVNEVTREIVDAAYSVHSRLGPGLFESVYEALLSQELERRGFTVRRQMAVPLEVDGLRFEEAFRIDLFVDQRVVVELKSIEQLAPVHTKQVLTYLRLMKLPLGLLINFGGATLKEGLRRVVNAYAP
jgi:GxxExxY protein